MRSSHARHVTRSQLLNLPLGCCAEVKNLKVCGINYSVTDVGTGPAVMLLHGFPNDHQLWKHQVYDERSRCNSIVTLTRTPCVLTLCWHT